MSNDVRSPAWAKATAGDLDMGSRSIRAVLTEFIKSFTSTPHAVTETTTNLEDVTHAINTGDNKVAGYMVWNSTTGLPLWADGPAAADTWSAATGTATHSPV